jgi:hypothetical protein
MFATSKIVTLAASVSGRSRLVGVALSVWLLKVAPMDITKTVAEFAKNLDCAGKSLNSGESGYVNLSFEMTSS